MEPAGEPTVCAITVMDLPAFHISQTCCRLSDGSPGRPIFAMLRLGGGH